MSNQTADNPFESAGTAAVGGVAAIDDLGLVPGDLIEVDYSLPEPGSSFPPRLKPGIYDFKFELEDDPFGRTSWKKDSHDFYEVRHKATITRTNDDGSKEDVTIRYIRATAYRDEKMRKAGMNSSLAELLRSLNVFLEKPISEMMVQDALRAADGRAFGRLALGWRVRFAGSETIFSTNPRRKKGEVAWPKDDHKQFTPMVTDPVSGQKAYGRENVTTYLMPVSGFNHEDKDETQFS